MAGRLREIAAAHGPEAILPYSYAGTMGLVQRNAGHAFFHALGASRLDRTICSPAKGAGWKAVMGETLAPHPDEVLASDLAIVWGLNAVATSIHFVAAAEGGAPPRGRGLGGRDLPHPHRRPRRPGVPGPARQRRGAGAGAGPRALPRRARRPRLPAGARPGLGALARRGAPGVHAGLGGGEDRARRRHGGGAGAPLRRGAGALHPAGERPLPLRQRRHERARHHLPAGAGGRLDEAGRRAPRLHQRQPGLRRLPRHPRGPPAPARRAS